MFYAIGGMVIIIIYPGLIYIILLMVRLRSSSKDGDYDNGIYIFLAIWENMREFP